MKLAARFLQLPLQFEADILARELATVRDSDWISHPLGFAGNDFLPLISAHGDPRNQSFDGPMRPTPFLSKDKPYLLEALGALGAVLGRTRLMRLSGQAEVSEHADVNYYWRERMRVHVPVITQPTVSFHCGGAAVHMAAGECWVFDTWRLHRVINDHTRARIHLVVDTVGGEGMMSLLASSRAPDRPSSNWSARKVTPTGTTPILEFESVNVPKIMSPWELREHLSFVLSEAAPNQRAAADVARVASSFVQKWRLLWAAYGDAEAGWPRYRALLARFEQDLIAAHAGDLLLVNEVDILETIRGMILSSAINPSLPVRPPQNGTA